MSGRSRRLESRQVFWIALLTAAGLMAAFAVGLIPPFRVAGLAWLDRFQPGGRLDNRLVVVAVDERTQAAIGWEPAPWGTSRGLRGYAELLEALQSFEPAVIVLDPWSSSVSANYEDVTSRQILGRAVELSGPVAVVMEPNRTSAELASATAIGTRGLAKEDDLVVRSIGVLTERGTESPTPTTTAHITLLGALLADGLPPEVKSEPDAVVIGKRRVPVIWNGEAGGARTSLMRVRFHAELLPGGGRVISASDVLQGGLDRASLNGKVVVVGMTMPDQVQLVPTPAGRTDIGTTSVAAVPPVFVVANGLNTLLTGDFLQVAPAAAVLGLVLGVSLVVAVTGVVGPMWLGPAMAALSWVSLYITGRVAFAAGWIVGPLRPTAAITAVTFGAITLRGAQELGARRRISRLFATYVPAAVARQLLAGGRAEAAASGERLQVSILFCDLRGFTPLAATLAPADLRRLLERFYDDLSAIVFAHGGTVLQYTGDEIFAVFGAPLPGDDHATAALRAAEEILAAAPALNAALVQQGLPSVAYGIGVNSGEVIAAHIGSSIRKQYSVMGDPVNVCARLCSSAEAGEALIAAATFASVDTAVQPTTSITRQLELKGIDRRIVAHVLLDRNHRPGSRPTSRDD